jgi:hypothetical protein
MTQEEIAVAPSAKINKNKHNDARKLLRGCFLLLASEMLLLLLLASKMLLLLLASEMLLLLLASEMLLLLLASEMLLLLPTDSPEVLLASTIYFTLCLLQEEIAR